MAKKIIPNITAPLMAQVILAQHGFLPHEGEANPAQQQTEEGLTQELGENPHKVDVQESFKRVPGLLSDYTNEVEAHILDAATNYTIALDARAKATLLADIPNMKDFVVNTYSVTVNQHGITGDLGLANIAGSLASMSSEEIARFVVSHNAAEVDGADLDIQDITGARNLKTSAVSSGLKKILDEAKIAIDEGGSTGILMYLDSNTQLFDFLSKYRPDAMSYLQEMEPDNYTTLKHLSDKERLRNQADQYHEAELQRDAFMTP